MSEPTGPHGSLLVATAVSMRTQLASMLSRTIAHFDLYGRIPLGDILQRQSVAEHIASRPAVLTLTLLTTFDMTSGHERLKRCLRRRGWTRFRDGAAR
jgi:hypothetical protein